MNYSIVWFKRDLRVNDNEALSRALAQGPVLCLYILEPSYWGAADVSQRQLDFLKESLRDLARALKQIQLNLCLMTGEVTDVLAKIYEVMAFSQVYSHMETGNLVTYKRDTTVAKWFASNNIIWFEHRQHGVLRGLKKRNAWNTNWAQLMHSPQFTVGCTIVDKTMQGTLHKMFPCESWPQTSGWFRNNESCSQPCTQPQAGGRAAGLTSLNSFLGSRSGSYVGGISSPLKATTACSRLSPYLSLGCLSMREVVQATQAQINDESTNAYKKRGLNNFLSRLHWHCHFIQKLESEPEIEWRNMHTGFDGLREPEFNPEHFTRLISATTGWPLVDACVTMLKETGWLNFRMRAMLISVASYPLWLHWREVGNWLASQFVDYEPGIHWSQVQMQAGTTGINTTRVYNPIKQAMDHDPDGQFVRRWLPVLQKVPDKWIFAPWKMPQDVQLECGVILGRDWPLPIVDLTQATRESKKRFHDRKKASYDTALNSKILEKHASQSTASSPKRFSSQPRKTKNKEPQPKASQLQFDF